jgi:hypothetical protein
MIKGIYEGQVWSDRTGEGSDVEVMGIEVSTGRVVCRAVHRSADPTDFFSVADFLRLFSLHRNVEVAP